jgi:hypothetical protein
LWPVGTHQPICHYTAPSGSQPTIVLNPKHWLVMRARQAQHLHPEHIAWLLLAIYAHVNARLEPVTNDHELEFQRRVADALERGVLTR